MATIKDVAKRANVSLQLYHMINKTRFVAERDAMRWAAIKELHYSSAPARSLKVNH